MTLFKPSFKSSFNPVVLFLFATIMAGCSDDVGPAVLTESGPAEMALVTVNLEGLAAECGGICSAEAEGLVQSRLLELSADVVVLQGVLSDAFCAQADHASLIGCSLAGSQIEKILPEEYTYRCDSTGTLCTAAFGAAELPPVGVMDEYSVAFTYCVEAKNDPSIAAVPVPALAGAIRVGWHNGGFVKVANVDWPEQLEYGPCRNEAIKALFQGEGNISPVVDLVTPTVVAGTFGFDPYAQEPYLTMLTETIEWHTFVGSQTDVAYSYISGSLVEGLDQPPVTDQLAVPAIGRVDHVIGHAVSGACALLDGKTASALDVPGGNKPVAPSARHFGYYCKIPLEDLAVE